MPFLPTLCVIESHFHFYALMRIQRNIDSVAVDRRFGPPRIVAFADHFCRRRRAKTSQTQSRIPTIDFDKPRAKTGASACCIFAE
jgi:hypothetical protein